MNLYAIYIYMMLKKDLIHQVDRPLPTEKK